MKFRSYSFSECGSRRRNEDYLRIVDRQRQGRFLAVLCDGMGGYGSGDVAARTVADCICTCWARSASSDDSAMRAVKVDLVCNEAHQALVSKAACVMGTTMAMVSIVDGETIFAHCGDSRIYLVRNGQIIYRSADHVGLSPEGWPVVTRCFSTVSEDYHPDVEVYDLLPDDRILLCSDGVYGSGKSARLEHCLLAIDCDIETIESIAASPSHDNYSAILITVQGPL